MATTLPPSGRQAPRLHPTAQPGCEAEARLRVLFDGLPVPTFLLHARDGVLYVEASNAAARESGAPSPTQPNVRVEDYIKGDGACRLLYTCLLEGTQVVAETAVQLPGWAAPRDCRLRTSRLLEDEVLVHVVELHPATQTIDTNESLSADRRFRALVENAIDCIALASADGCILYATASIERLTGFPASEMQGHNIFDFINEFERERARAALADLVANPGSVRRLQLRTLKGRILDLVARNLLHDAEVGGVVVNVRDVTEHVERETALVRDEEHLALLLTQMPGMLWTTDTELRLTSVRGSGDGGFGNLDRLEGMMLADSLNGYAPREQAVAVHEAALAGEPGTYEIDRLGRRYTAYVRPLVKGDSVIGTIGVAADITQKSETEEQLRLKTETLERILDHLPQMVTFFDQERAVLLVNRAFERITGWTQQEAPRIDLFAACYPEPALRARAAAFVNAAAGEWADFEMRRADGSRLTAKWMNVRLADGSIIGIGEDVTERRRAEHALHLAREQYQAVLDSIPDMAWLKDRDSTFLAVNQAFARGFGMPREQLIGKCAHDIFPADLADRMRGGDLVVMANGTARFQEQLPLISGEVRWVETVKSPYRDHTGRVVGTAGIARDCTEQRLAAQKLHENEERFRLIVEGSDQVFFFMHDREGHFEYLSPSIQAVLGYHPEAMIGEHYTAMLSPEEYDNVVARTNATMSLAAPGAPYTLTCIRSDGRRVPIEITETRVIRDGEVVGVQGFARDVTQRRRLEAQVQQAQKMDAVGRLAGGVAHDFNNVLTVINGNADAALLDPAVSPGMRDCLAEIRTAAERGAALTRQLLAFSRKEAPQRVPVELNTVVRGMQKMLARLIGEDVRLVVNLTPDLGYVHADPAQLEQVLLNLAVNARDAMPSGGELSITTKRSEAPRGVAPAAGPWVLLEVRDTGVGIAPDVLPHIFEPFFTTRERGKGTGLGLATTYAVVEQSGGVINVDSRPGEGAHFRIFLPVHEATGSPAVVAAELQADGGRETVLLVEDDRSVRTVVRRTLERLGYDVVEAEHGSAALTILNDRREPFDLIISDVIMPVMSGPEMVEQLRLRGVRLPILFISGYAGDSLTTRLQHDVPLLPKPFSREQLDAAVRRLLDANIAERSERARLTPS